MLERTEQIVDLLDTQQRQIGQMRIERQEEDLLIGTFVPGPAFPSVEPLFRAFEAAADVQALHVIDELDAAIEALGLRLRWPEAPESMAIDDVQIWSDGGISCRLCGQPGASANAEFSSMSRRHAVETTNRLTTRCSGRGKQPPRR
ncbi:MAG: hypothetical protein ACRERE_07140 [Candidatus Entotheonellia bacterium]